MKPPRWSLLERNVNFRAEDCPTVLKERSWNAGERIAGSNRIFQQVINSDSAKFN